MMGSIVSAGFRDNAIFDLAGAINRDNCLYPWWLLRETFAKRGVDLNTEDMVRGRAPAFELHVDALDRGGEATARFLLMMETPLTWPANARRDLLARYRRVFAWDDDLVREIGATKIHYPLYSQPVGSQGWKARHSLCCMIAGNKSANVRDWRELYSERVRTIRWFEAHAPADFDLYGVGWNAPAPGPGRARRAMAKAAGYVMRLAGMTPFPSYRGPVRHKLEVLAEHRFSICYENAQDFHDYVTEKIFDSFAAGCVPVYWGAPNVTDSIPASCFIDRRAFASLEELHAFLKGMTEREFVEYQDRISEFLAGPAIAPFLAQTFADTIVDGILSDLPRLEPIAGTQAT